MKIANAIFIGEDDAIRPIESEKIVSLYILPDGTLRVKGEDDIAFTPTAESSSGDGNDKVKVSVDDQFSRFLEDKIQGDGSTIQIDVINDSGDEYLEVKSLVGGVTYTDTSHLDFDTATVGAWATVTMPASVEDKIVTVCVTTGTGGGDRDIGVRAVGSGVNKVITVKKDDTPMEFITTVSATNEIEVFKSDASVDFCLLGYFNS